MCYVTDVFLLKKADYLPKLLVRQQAELKDSAMIFSDTILIKAWKELPEDDRLMLYLVDVERLSQEKVAMIMGHPTVVVKYRTGWARTQLKKELAAGCRTAELRPAGFSRCK